MTMTWLGLQEVREATDLGLLLVVPTLSMRTVLALVNAIDNSVIDNINIKDIVNGNNNEWLMPSSST